MGNEKEGQLASMIEKLFYIVDIDEQIMKYTCKRRGFVAREQQAVRVLADVRGEIKQSLQADIKKFLGTTPPKASTEIKKAYNYESLNETYLRIKTALAPIFKRKRIIGGKNNG